MKHLPAIAAEEGKAEDKSDHKKENPVLERYPIINIKDFMEKNSINVEDPDLEKLEEINAKVPDLEIDKQQYQFVLDDLKKTNQNKNIEWIFVMFHKPMYSSISKQLEEYIIRDKYQEIFDKYNVDLVIQGHNHIYSRTLPLSFNKQQISEPILDQSNNANSNNNSTFTNPNGIIYLVVGTGGDELYKITGKPYYVQNQYDKGFGFVDLKIDGKRLDGTFYDINLDCKMKITEKKKKEVLDLESCVPSALGDDELKIIDQFTIIAATKANATETAGATKANATETAGATKANATETAGVTKANATETAGVTKANATETAGVTKANATETAGVTKANATETAGVTKANATETAGVTKANATETAGVTKANATETAGVTKANATETAGVTKANATETAGVTKANATETAGVTKANATEINRYLCTQIVLMIE